MRYLFSFLLIVLVRVSFAGNEIYSERIEKAEIDVLEDIDVYDARYFEMEIDPLWPSLYTNKRVTNKVQLGYIFDDYPSTDQSTTVQVQIEKWEYVNNSFVVTTEIRDLQLNYYGNIYSVLDDKSTFTFEDAHRVKVTILSVQGPIDHVYLESSVEVERYYEMNTSPIVNYGVNYLNYSNSAAGLVPLIDPVSATLKPELEFWWDEVSGAEEYELEWVFINNRGIDNTTFAVIESPATELEFDFYSNSSRVQLKDNHYKIPGIFNQGYLVYRVRPIGRQGSDFQYRLEGNWSFVESSTIDDFDANSAFGAVKFAVDYEEGKNWSHSASYTEDGKRFESIAYFDGIGRARQSIARNTVTEQVVVNNAYFDKSGRPVISHLPTPVDGESMSFRENFNYLVLSNNGSPSEVPFTLENYLLENDDCELPNPMSQNRGTGWYYSANNQNQDGANAYIPNANGYPFNKVIYKNDPTGRVQEVGGFGLDLQTSEHGAKMFYVTPSQDELNRLFGTDVGLNEHYQKSTTVDANGQAYIQYTDLAGRVIATALSGPNPANLESLENNTGPVLETNVIYTDLLDDNIDPLIASYTYYPGYFSTSQELVLSHDFDPAVFEDAQCINGICFDCHYTFKIRVDKIDCSPITTVYDYSNDINGFVINQACNNLPYDGGSNHILNLDAGEYVITKELKVNSELAEDYWCEYIDNADQNNADCAPNFVSIYDAYYDNADFDCEPGSPVVVAPYTYCDFKRKQLMSDLFIGGQYGEVLDATGAINPSVHPLSIYNSSNQLPSGNDWKSPTGDYLDESGNIALIPITPLGNNTFLPQIDPSANIITVSGVQYVHPEDLAFVSDFIQYAELSWMDALVENHPEYCYLQFCEQKSGNYHAFSSELENTFTFDEACANGMFTPLGVTSLPSVLTSCANTPSITDDFFTTGYFSGNIALWAAENYECVPIISNTSIVGQSTTYSSSLNNYYQVEENGIVTGQLSIWQYAVWQAVCPNETTYASIISCVNNATLDDCNKELIWQYFKLAYQDIRERAFLFAQTAYVSFPAHLMGGSNCSLSNNACFSFENWKAFNDLTAANAFGCLNVEVHYDVTGLDQTAGSPTVLNPDPDDIGAGPCSHLTALLYADKTPNFLNFYEPNYTLPPGVDLTTTSGQQAFMASQVETICQDYCASQADMWMLSIDGCLSQSSGLPWDETNPTYVNIRNGLIEVCAAGCDATNIYGSSTLPQGVVTASGFNSFEDVLEYYLSGYSGYGNADCSYLLISSPAPMGANPNQIINQPLDDCACDKVLQAKLDFATNTNPSITSIAEMLAYNEGVNLSTAASLACACEHEYETAHGTSWTPGASWLPTSVTNLTSSNILVPEELTCDFTERCSDCVEINALYASFIGIFGSGIELHPNYEVLLENYMNFSLGYNLNGESYESFMESCNSTTNDPSCATTQLTPVFLDLFDVIIRRGQLLEVNLDLTDNIVFANSSISTIFGGSMYSGVQNGSSLTTTFGTQTVTFTLPQGADFDFSDILTVSNFLAVPCTMNDQFTLVAAIMKCGVLEYRTIEGVTSDFNFVNCYCGNSGQEICDNPQSVFISDDCYKEELIAINALSMSEYLSELASKKMEFIVSYNAQCATAFETEKIIEAKEWNNYQFTLFYYDQAGNLIQTVAPKGVDLGFKSSGAYTTVDTDRDGAIVNIPSHTFKTVYEYNSYNQLVSTTNPDQDGYTKFWYDRYGRIIASQNPVQAPYQYSYSLYDEYGRPVEVGQANRSIPGTIGNPGNPGYTLAQFTEAQIKQDDLGVWFRNWVNTCVKTEVTITTYDDFSDASVAAKFKQSPVSKNLRLRVAQVRYYPSLTAQTNLNTDYESAIYYNYDQHGNVTEQVQDIPMMEVIQQDLKSTQYEFELISGNVSKVRYQADEKDQFTHEYLYDKLNRLTEVFSSSDGIHKVREAHYYYYDYGPLARTELGDHKVQGQDFAYTINGWLKALNGSTLDPTMEIGKDAYSGYLAQNTSIHMGVAKDINAYTIGYFEGDYSAISGNDLELATLGTPFADQGRDLFNGNIRHLVTSIFEMQTFGTAYRYDQLNRLKEMQAYHLNGTWSNTLATNDYYNNYIYDENGNITDLQRNGTAATNSLFMDQFSYSYGTVGGQLSNRLNYVADTGADDITSIEGDIKSGQQTNNYQYDALGQLTKDVQEGITSIVWRKGDKKIKSMTQNDNSPDLEFYYNPFGIRIAKVEKTKSNGVLNSQDQWKWTYYSYDANGQSMAVYDILKSSTYNKASLAEQHIYGSSRLGMVKNYQLLYNNGSQLPSESIVKQHELGERRYELTNHLGNVQALITDRKTWNATDQNYEAVVIMTSDYYPFGMKMPGGVKAGAQPTGTTEVLVEEPVIYADLDLVVNDEGDLVLTDKATPGWYHGAISEQSIENNEYIEFEIPNTPLSDNYYFVGLSYNETDYNNNTINYGIYIRSNGDLRILSNGTQLYSSTYAIGDKLKIKRDNGTIRFYRNGTQLYTLVDSDVSASTLVDLSMFRFASTLGCKVFNLVAGKYQGVSLLEQPVIYTGLSGAQVDNNGDLYVTELCALGGDKYGASSVQTVESGEYIEFEVANTPIADNYYFVGLSYQNASNQYTTIDNSWYISPVSAGAIIYEQGTSVYNVAYAQGDKFKIERSGGNIVYYKNGVSVRTVADPNLSASMVLDITIGRAYGFNQQGCKVYNLVVGKKKTIPVYDPSDYISYINYEDYRYAYNGMEQDNEVSGNGNSYTTEFRQYDPRLGRWKSLDPLMAQFPWMSPYVAFNNNPVFYVDPLGLEGEPTLQSFIDAGYASNNGTGKIILITDRDAVAKVKSSFENSGFDFIYVRSIEEANSFVDEYMKLNEIEGLDFLSIWEHGFDGFDMNRKLTEEEINSGTYDRIYDSDRIGSEDLKRYSENREGMGEGKKYLIEQFVSLVGKVKEGGTYLQLSCYIAHLNNDFGTYLSKLTNHRSNIITNSDLLSANPTNLFNSPMTSTENYKKGWVLNKSGTGETEINNKTIMINTKGEGVVEWIDYTIDTYDIKGDDGETRTFKTGTTSPIPESSDQD